MIYLELTFIFKKVPISFSQLYSPVEISQLFLSHHFLILASFFICSYQLKSIIHNQNNFNFLEFKNLLINMNSIYNNSAKVEMFNYSCLIIMGKIIMILIIVMNKSSDSHKDTDSMHSRLLISRCGMQFRCDPFSHLGMIRMMNFGLLLFLLFART